MIGGPVEHCWKKETRLVFVSFSYLYANLNVRVDQQRNRDANIITSPVSQPAVTFQDQRRTHQHPERPSLTVSGHHINSRTVIHLLICNTNETRLSLPTCEHVLHLIKVKVVFAALTVLVLIYNQFARKSANNTSIHIIVTSKQ